MRVAALSLAIALFVPGAALVQSQASTFPPGTGVILKDSAAAVLRQCTRRTPRNVERFWQPTDSVVRVLEGPLLELLRDVLPRVRIVDRPQPTLRAEQYYRQYVGIVRGGKRLVYVNGFPPPDSLSESIAGKGYWRRLPIEVCDGGPYYFGVVYDVERRAFEPIDFNDGFSGPVRY